MASFSLILKRNLKEVNNLNELLYILFNCPEKLRTLTVDFDQNNMNLENTNPQYLLENRKRIILEMMEIYDKFKVDKIQSKRNETNWRFEFKFNQNTPKTNFVYFTVLEIMVLMKIEINNFYLEGCPLSELVEFLEKHKSFDKLNIYNIDITDCGIIDKKNIDKLCQYSHLIGNKISILVKQKNTLTQIALIDIFYSRSRNYNNFVVLSQEALPFITKTLNFVENDFSDYIVEIKTLKNKLKSYNDVYFSKHIRRLKLDLDENDIESFSNQFSFLKEYEYDLRIVDFYNGKKIRIHKYLKMFFMVFETICNSKYRQSKVNHFQYEIQNAKLSRKFKRFLKIHNIGNIYLNNLIIELNL